MLLKGRLGSRWRVVGLLPFWTSGVWIEIIKVCLVFFVCIVCILWMLCRCCKQKSVNRTPGTPNIRPLSIRSMGPSSIKIKRPTAHLNYLNQVVCLIALSSLQFDPGPRSLCLPKVAITPLQWPAPATDCGRSRYRNARLTKGFLKSVISIGQEILLGGLEKFISHENGMMRRL